MKKKKIIIVKPGILNDDNRLELRQAGYIIIETETPKDIQVFDELGFLDSDSYLEIALTAIEADNNGAVRGKFEHGVRLAIMSKIKANKQPTTV